MERDHSRASEDSECDQRYGLLVVLCIEHGLNSHVGENLKLSYTRSTAAISKACRHGLMSVHSAPYALLRPPVEMNLRELDPVEQLPCASAWSLSEEGLIAEPAEDLRHTLTSA